MRTNQQLRYYPVPFSDSPNEYSHLSVRKQHKNPMTQSAELPFLRDAKIPEIIQRYDIQPDRREMIQLSTTTAAAVDDRSQ